MIHCRVKASFVSIQMEPGDAAGHGDWVWGCRSWFDDTWRPSCLSAIFVRCSRAAPGTSGATVR